MYHLYAISKPLLTIMVLMSWFITADSVLAVSDISSNSDSRQLKSINSTLNASETKVLESRDKAMQNLQGSQSSNESETGVQSSGIAEQDTQDSDSAASQQAAYPGVENKLFQAGKSDEPQVKIFYPEFGNAACDKVMSDFAINQGENYEKDIRDSFGPGEEKPDSFDSWEMTGFYTLERPGPNVVSVTFNIYSYTGGAHGNFFINCVNYDLEDNKLLTFDDLFKDTEKALELLSSISEEKLRLELGDEVDEEMLKSGTSPEVNNFLNLSLIPDGIVVEFQPYQIGPWSIGAQHAEIPLESLKEAGPNPQVWPEANKL